MKRTLILIASCVVAIHAMAQDASVSTSNDSLTRRIEELENRLGSIEASEAERSENELLASIWKPRKYINIGIGSQTLTEKGVDAAEPLKSKLAMTLQMGRTYKLYKKPIANMVMIGFDWTKLDLSFAKFKTPDIVEAARAAKADTQASESANTSETMPVSLSQATKDYAGFDVTDLGYYQLDAGMAFGLSVHVTPFYTLGKGLEYIKASTFFHVIPSYSAILQSYDGEVKWSSGYSTFYSWGIGLSWKALYLGFETRWNSKSKYNTSKFNDDLDDVEVDDKNVDLSSVFNYGKETRYKTTASRFVIGFRF